MQFDRQVHAKRFAAKGAHAALDLAKAMGSKLQPYYVIENTPMYFDAPGYDPSILRNQMIAQGNELAAEFNKRMSEKGVAGEMTTGEASSLEDVPTLVLNAARTLGADLIVMGTHGRRGFQRLILGSVAERCVRQSTLPVLLVPSAAGAQAAA